jgi:hypothetical protein
MRLGAPAPFAVPLTIQTHPGFDVDGDIATSLFA